MSAIGVGDLVMVVRPTACCGSTKKLGFTFKVTSITGGLGRCAGCGAVSTHVSAKNPENGRWITLDRLKKIDPPETGDSLPTRADLNLPEPACP